MPIDVTIPSAASREAAVERAFGYPRLRYMGSKYRLIPALAEVFEDVGGSTALDAFSGSGVVSYLLKSMGYAVTSNDFLNFPGVIATATTVNNSERLSEGDIATICGPAADDRDFIQRTFQGLYFNDDDRKFLDSAWSHIDLMSGNKRAVAISALVLSAARRQPRGVFTFTDSAKYNDGRRDLTISLRDHFAEHVQTYNNAVFDNGRTHTALTGDVYTVPTAHDVVYLDPPYAPPRDDADYMKRYHFLEGLSIYWRGQQIMDHTKTKKIAKKYTPFAYKRSAAEALRTAFKRFHESTLVVSYSSNAIPDADTIVGLLREFKDDVTVTPIQHTYSFGTHAAATRRSVDEYLFVAR